MPKIVKINLYFLLLPFALYLTGCNSGEYDIEQYQVTYTEKSLNIDTLKKITIDETDIKEDKRIGNSESYSYTIQIGAFSIQENMDKFLEQAKTDLDENVFFIQSGGLLKVRIGTFSSRADAIKRIEFVKSKGYNDAFIVTRRN